MGSAGILASVETMCKGLVRDQVQRIANNNVQPHIHTSIHTYLHTCAETGIERAGERVRAFAALEAANPPHPATILGQTYPKP